MFESAALSFHDAFLEALRKPHDALAAASDDASDGTSFALSMTQRQRHRHVWRAESLQRFLATYFPVYQQPEVFARLERLLRADQASGNQRHEHERKAGDVAVLAVTFDELKLALDQHSRERLDEKDVFPLEPEIALSSSSISSGKSAAEAHELALPRLQTPPLSDQSILPMPSAWTDSGGALTVSVGTTSVRGDSAKAAGRTSLPVLKDFQAEVMKKSQNWLGRWQTRYLFLRWGELEICKKNTSVASFRHSLTSTFASSSTSSSFHSSTASGILKVSTDATGRASHSTAAASTTALHSKRYPLRHLVSMQVIQLNDSDSTKKQALHLQFMLPAPSGSGQITKLLVLGSDKKETVPAVLSQLATFCLFYELSSCRSAAVNPQRVQSFIEAGARVDLYCPIPMDGHALSSPLSPLQLALLVNPSDPTFTPTIQALLQAGASAGSLLNWDFASQVLFSASFDSEARALSRRELVLRERIGDVGFRCGGVPADDQYAWNLLMYFCCHGDFESAHTLLQTAYSKSRSNCLRYLDLVNSSGDTALHIAIKASQHHSRAEELAMLLVDIAVNAAFAADREGVSTAGALSSSDADNSSSSIGKPTVPLASASSLTDSQLVHICDGNGDAVFHLALKARLWKLVNKLVDCRAVDPMSCDSFGNNSLHLVIKVGAPRHIIARIVQLYRPQRSSAFNSTNTERDQLVSMLGFESRERRANDTPLTLAIKYRQQDVAELLLSSGASPDVAGVDWLSMLRHSLRQGPGASASRKARFLVGSGDLPVHVAIKSGLSAAAASLVAHGASITATDSNGSSPLALAIRFGMYVLASEIARRLAAGSDQAQSTSRESAEFKVKQWLDGETGIPVVMLAIKAGQLELASMLLDRQPAQISLTDSTTKEGLLHILAKLLFWLDVSTNKGEYPQESVGEHRLSSYRSDLGSPRAIAAPTVKWKRDRLKSKSDGDLRHMRLTNLTAHFAYPHPPTTMSRQNAKGEEADNQRAETDPDIARERAAFLQQAIEIQIQCILRSLNDEYAMSSPSRCPPTMQQTQLPFHLPTKPPLIVTDHNSDACTPLHIAAAGGKATTGVLCLMLAFIHERVASSMEAAHMLTAAVGTAAETALHAALASNSAFNGLLLLLYSQVLIGERSIAESSFSRARGSMSSQWGEVESMVHESFERVTSDGNSPLHLATHWPCNPNMLHVIDVLFQEKAYAGCWNREGLAPLHVAIRNRCDARLIRLFARHGQDLNVWTEGRARSGSNQDANISSVRSIHQGETTSKNEEGESGTEGAVEFVTPKNPLMVAIEAENLAAFRELVACGADVRVVTPQTRMGLLQWALRLGVQSPDLIELLLSFKILTNYHVVDQFGISTGDAITQLKERVQQLTLSPRAGPTAMITQQTLRRSVSTALAVSPRGKMIDSEGIQTAATHSAKSQPVAELNGQPPGRPVSADAAAALPPPLAPFRTHAGKTSMSGTADRHQALHVDADSKSGRYSMQDASGYLPVGRPIGSPSRSPSGHSRSSLFVPHHFQSTMKAAPALDVSTLDYLREEEKATLTLVAHEARQEAQEWLKKRVGQKKLLSDAHVQLQAALTHRRTGSGSIPLPDDRFAATGGGGSSFVQADETATNEQLALQKYKELAAKRFIDKHVADAVADARTEIEREKQAVFQETGVYPGPTSSFKRDRSKTRGMSRSGSSNGSFMLPSRADRNQTQLSGSDDSVWWSERGTSFFADENFTWLSSPSLSPAGSGSMATRSGFGGGNDGRDRLRDDSIGKQRDGEPEGHDANSQDRDSFTQVIKTRNSVS